MSEPFESILVERMTNEELIMKALIQIMEENVSNGQYIQNELKERLTPEYIYRLYGDRK